MSTDPELDSALERIGGARRRAPAARALVTAVSGIDGSGKGHVTGLLAEALAARGYRTAVIHADGWLNLPAVRFDAQRSPAHFYRNAFRFEALFRELVLPLRARRSLRLEMSHAAETAEVYERRVLEYDDVDIVLLEAIFLLKRELRPVYDVALWIDCSRATALGRAVARAQEGLSPEATVHAYRTLYFPAQDLHGGRDRPREAATAVVVNDPGSGPWPDPVQRIGRRHDQEGSSGRPSRFRPGFRPPERMPP